MLLSPVLQTKGRSSAALSPGSAASESKFSIVGQLRPDAERILNVFHHS